MTYAAAPARLSEGLAIAAKDNIIRMRMTNVVIIQVVATDYQQTVRSREVR